MIHSLLSFITRWPMDALSAGIFLVTFVCFACYCLYHPNHP